MFGLRRTTEGRKNAVLMEITCFFAYMTVYFSRNILSVATPEMLRVGYTTEYIGILSTGFMITYAVGQLVNGIIGDYIKSKYMMCLGMIFAALSSVLFLNVDNRLAKVIFYALGGFSLSMVYAPMTKLIIENLEHKYVTGALLLIAIASYVASPAVGVAAVILRWNMLFVLGQCLLVISAVMCFSVITHFEKKGVVKYRKLKDENTDNKDHAKIKELFNHEIVRYSFVSVFTGIIRTSVVFWIPTMLVQYMKYPEKTAVGIFTVISTLVAFVPYIGVSIYRFVFRKNIKKTMFASFSFGAVCFFLMCADVNQSVNVILLVLALISGNVAASMLWNVYCPSLKETGVVSGATGYLDFLSYIGSAIANLAFSNAAVSLGWKVLLAVWGAIMLAGVFTSLPNSRKIVIQDK